MGLSEIKKRFLFMAFAAVDFFAAIEVTSLIVAAPKVADYFQIDQSNIFWILNSYLFTIFGILVLFYFISEYFHSKIKTKTFFIAGLTLFFVGSVFCVISSNIQMFYIARIIQGIGAAMSFIGQLWMMTKAFKDEIQKPLMWTETGAALGVVAGPFLGGIFSDMHLWGWKFLFEFNALVVMAAAVIVWLFYRETENQISFSAKKLRNDFYFAMIIIVLAAAVAVASEFVVSIFLQQFKNYSGIKAGMVLFSGSLGLVFGSAIAAGFKTKKQQQVTRGLWGMLISVILIGLVLAKSIIAFAPIAFFVFGFFYGFLGVVLYAYISHMLPKNLIVKGVTVYLIALQLGNAVGIYMENVWRFANFNFEAFTILMLVAIFVAIVFASSLTNLENIEGDLYEIAPIRKTPFIFAKNLLEEIKNFFQAMFYVVIIIPFRYVMGIKSYNVDDIEIEDQMLIIANHGARLDAWVILAGMGFKNFMKLHPFRIPIAKPIYETPVLRWLFAGTGMYKIESKGDLDESLKDTMDNIENGHSILFFPEGKMIKDGEIGEPRKGVAHIVKKKDVNILPVRIFYKRFNAKKRGKMRGAAVFFGETFESKNLLESCNQENLHSEIMQKVYELEKSASKYLRRKTKQTAHLIEHTDENSAHLVSLHNGAFHDGGQYDDPEFFNKVLREEKNINIVLKDGDDVAGLLIARPHNDVYEELKEDDPHMMADENRYYIETMGVLPEYRGKFGHLKMTYKVIEEAKRRGIKHFSMHARKSNGLSDSLQQLFGKKLTHIREIESWKWVNGESYHYIEGTFNKSLFTLKLMINSFIITQKIDKKIKKVKKRVERLLAH